MTARYYTKSSYVTSQDGSIDNLPISLPITCIYGMFPNQRGHARRAGDKHTRLGTHVPVMAACYEALGPSAETPVTVFEHGMGTSSTPFIHTLTNVVSFVSFEGDRAWARCADCAKQPSLYHTIYATADPTQLSKELAPLPTGRSLALIDGPGPTRSVALGCFMSIGVTFIIEHDAETYTLKDIAARRDLAHKHGYGAFQYVALNPESTVFVSSSSPHLPLTGSCVTL